MANKTYQKRFQTLSENKDLDSDDFEQPIATEL
jgi:hypothetical protein